MKKVLLYPVVLCLFCLLLGITGCSGTKKEEQNEKKVEVSGDISEEVVYAVNVDGTTNIVSFENVLMNRSKFWGSLVFQGLLIAKDDITNVQLDLCEEYTISPDGKTYVFILKEDIFWHDGRPLTVDDVVWSIETSLMCAEVNGFMKKGLQEIMGASLYAQGKTDSVVGIETEGNTIIIKLERAYEMFLASLAQMPVLPRHCFSDSERVNLGQSDFWNMPIGSGPYKLVYNEKEQDYVFVINENYSGKKPKIPQFRFTVLENPKEDDFDMTITSDPDTIEKFKNIPKYEVVQTNNLYYRYLILNLDGRKTVNKDLLSDKRVRQALVLGLDRESMNQEIYEGIALNIDGGIPYTDSWYVEGDASRSGYQHELAKQLLEEAGFDFDATLVLTRYHADELSVKILETVADYWRDLGIKVVIEPIDSTDTTDLWVETDWYDVGLKNLAAVDYSEWYYEYSSNNQLWSVILNQRTEFDALISAITGAKWSSERSELYKEIQKLEREYIYKIPLAIIPQYVIYNKEKIHIPDIQFPNMWYYYDLELSQWELK